MSYHQALPSSFRDPSGFLFRIEGELYRQINESYSSNYEKLMSSGLYDVLVKAHLLIPHEEMEEDLAVTSAAYKVIKPIAINYISYPHEWCFSQLKDAALATMKIQMVALKYGMILKDASAYNIQFFKGKPVLIDTLSFEQYPEGQPWVAYKQFCQHFIAPLALMSYTDIRLNQLFRANIDGIPLDLASSILPRRSYLKYSLLTHIHLHAKTQAKYADSAGESDVTAKPRRIGKAAFGALMESIRSAVTGLTWDIAATEWGDYYADTNYQTQSMQHKEELVKDYLGCITPKPAMVQDLGANTGHFSRLAAKLGMQVIAQDIDPAAVEKNYLAGLKDREENILPLLLDLTNPSPAMGWALDERMSFLNRNSNANTTVLALALVHHLAISNNVPLGLIAKFFARICKNLIIEFVPKEDSQVKRLLSTREDIFTQYNLLDFESVTSKYFKIVRSERIRDSERTLFLLESL